MGKLEFQKTFGFDQDRNKAKYQANRREWKVGARYKVLTIITGGLG